MRYFALISFLCTCCCQWGGQTLNSLFRIQRFWPRWLSFRWYPYCKELLLLNIEEHWCEKLCFWNGSGSRRLGLQEEGGHTRTCPVLFGRLTVIWPTLQSRYHMSRDLWGEAVSIRPGCLHSSVTEDWVVNLKMTEAEISPIRYRTLFWRIDGTSAMLLRNRRVFLDLFWLAHAA